MNKFGKSKIVSVAAASLAAVAVASVGFSAWVVTTLKGTDVEDIAVTVADVQDGTITLSDAKAAYPSGSGIRFDADKAITDGVFKASVDSAPQLDFTINVNVTLGDASEFKGISAWMEILQGDETKITDTEKTEGMYVVSPIAIGVHNTTWSKPGALTKIWDSSAITAEMKKDATTKNALTSKTLSFGWGAFFNNSNPSNLKDESKLSSYKAALNAMKTTPYKFRIHLELDK